MSSGPASKKPGVSILLPTFNERENLPIIVYLIDKHLKDIDWQIVIVEDSSPDGTLEVAQWLQELHGQARIYIHTRKGKLGLGSAYMDGIKFATHDFVVIMDADMSHHPESIPHMLRKQQEHKNGFDIVTGSRYIRGGGVSGWDLRRKLTSRVANFIADTLLNPGCSDLTGSFRLYAPPPPALCLCNNLNMYKKKVLESIIKETKAKGYTFQMEMVIRARQQGFTIAEVPIVFVDRIFGESKLGISEITGYLKGVFGLFATV